MARLAAAYLCLALLAPALAAPALAQDGPISTTRDPERAPERVSTMTASSSAPADDYGYVSWCLGAVSGYVDQYPTAMPEVIRIERAFPTPSTEENIKTVYPEQRDAAKASLVGYREAVAAAEKASARSIGAYGAQAQAKGRAIWSGYAAANKARLGQFWMGWAAPADCDTRAQTLKAKSDLMGQALSFNATSAGEVMSAPPGEAAPEATPAEAAPAEAAPVEAAPAEAAAPGSIDDLLDAKPAAEPAPGKVAEATGWKPRAKFAPKLRGSR